MRQPTQDCPSLIVVMLIVGCGSSTGLKSPEFDAAADASSPADVPLAVDVPPDTFDAGRDGRTASGCFPFNNPAGSADLDVFLLMDQSMSMNERVAGGATKLESVAEATRAFVNETSSRGLSMALTLFPRGLQPRYSCDLGEECPGGIPCIGRGRCELSLETCSTAPNQCRGADICVAPLVCHRGVDPQQCTAEEPECRNGAACFPGGICADEAFCSDWAYRRPNVPLDTLPGAGGRIVDGITGTGSRRGSTPTLPALRGVIEAARLRLVERPERKAVVLIATDGLPSSCDADINTRDDSLGMVAPAAAAAAGLEDGIQTFVVGVFRPVEETAARVNLTTLAEAGGSGEPYIVSTLGMVASELLEALTQIRLTIQTCAYAIPAPGRLPERENIRVRLLDEDDLVVEELTRLGDASECGLEGGFYFREDGTPTPSVVELCPASCDFRAERNYRVFIEGVCPPEEE